MIDAPHRILLGALQETAMTVQFTADNHKQLLRIARRSIRLRIYVDVPDAVMDLDACHSNGCPLDFDKLESFDNFNFAHDVSGIRTHIDRETGQLAAHFLPRCAKP
jgi:hypothetical protein